MMVKKIIMIILALSVLGAVAGAFIYQVGSHNVEETSSGDLTVFRQVEAETSRGSGPAIAAQDSLGEPWQAIGTVDKLDDLGLTLRLENGDLVYIELGPPDYWQEQGVDIQVGQLVAVEGTISDDMIHAATVQFPDGQILELRSDQGQPLWSGGASNSQGQNRGGNTGDHTQEPQAQVDEWVTIDGTLMAFQGGNMTMSTADGELLTFQSGQPRFFASQNVTFQVGDEISVIGYQDGANFTAGEIIQLSTGLRVMLRDPNGRPLWAGPVNGNGKGNGGGGL